MSIKLETFFFTILQDTAYVWYNRKEDTLHFTFTFYEKCKEQHFFV